MQRGIQGALANQHRAAGGLIDPLSHRIAMAWAPREGLEDQKVESAAGETGGKIVHGSGMRGHLKTTAVPIVTQWERAQVCQATRLLQSVACRPSIETARIPTVGCMAIVI